MGDWARCCTAIFCAPTHCSVLINVQLTFPQNTTTVCVATCGVSSLMQSFCQQLAGLKLLLQSGSREATLRSTAVNPQLWVDQTSDWGRAGLVTKGRG